MDTLKDNKSYQPKILTEQEKMSIYRDQREKIKRNSRQKIGKVLKYIGGGLAIGAAVGTGLGFVGAAGVAVLSPMTAITTSGLGTTAMLGGAGVGAVSGGVSGAARVGSVLKYENNKMENNELFLLLQQQNKMIQEENQMLKKSLEEFTNRTEDILKKEKESFDEREEIGDENIE